MNQVAMPRNKARIGFATRQLHGDATMTKSTKHDKPSGNPTLWTVAALRWALEDSDQERGFGEEIETVEVPDREIAVAIAHHLVDKHAHRAIGKTTLEIHIAPPRELPADKERIGTSDRQNQRAWKNSAWAQSGFLKVLAVNR
jgi:hypothetical protein